LAANWDRRDIGRERSLCRASLPLAVPIAVIILTARIIAIALPAIVMGVLRQDG
jgi:hypothetical protein